MTPIAFVDVETLNLLRPVHGHDPGLWEVAVIRCNLDPVERTLTIVGNWWGYLDITADQMSYADPNSLRVNRFYERHPVYRPGACAQGFPHPWQPGAVFWPLTNPDGTINTIEIPGDVGPNDVVWQPVHAAVHLARILNGCHLVAANPSFDEERLTALLADHGQCLSIDYHLGCVRQLAAGWLAGRADAAGNQPTILALPPLSGSKLVDAVGVDVDHDGVHTAWGDAVAAMLTYGRIMALEVIQAGNSAMPDSNGQPLADEVWMMPEEGP